MEGPLKVSGVYKRAGLRRFVFALVAIAVQCCAVGGKGNSLAGFSIYEAEKDETVRNDASLGL